MITQQQLKALLHYNPDTGIFTRLTSTNRRLKAGQEVGYLNVSSGYINTSAMGKYYLAHRLAWLYMTGEWPKHQVDHINGIKSDNRFINLRDATQHMNSHNRPKPRTNTSGYKGVYRKKGTVKWIAMIKVNYKNYYSKPYDSAEQAYMRRIEMEKELLSFSTDADYQSISYLQGNL